MLKVFKPLIAKYSWFKFSSKMRLSASRTEGSTYGSPSSPLYAPAPTLTFLGSVSSWKACVNPKIGSAGPSGTSPQVEKAREAAVVFANARLAINLVARILIFSLQCRIVQAELKIFYVQQKTKRLPSNRPFLSSFCSLFLSVGYVINE